MSERDPGEREVARRAFAREFSEATYTFRESDEDRAPVYALLPTGVAANRVFIVGTLTETEDLGDETEYWRGRVVDPVGTFFVYAGQYQSKASDRLRETDLPAFVAVVGKPRTFETEAGTVNVSVRPETITVVDEATHTRWVVETAERTLDRIKRFDDPDNEYAAQAGEQYDVPIDVFQQDAIEALERLDEDSIDSDDGDSTGAGSDCDTRHEDSGPAPAG